MNATTTCAYSNPVMYNGDTPTNSLDFFQFASSTCETIQATSSPMEITFPSSMEVKDTGVIFGISLLIFLVAGIFFFGMFFGKHAQHD